MGNAEALDRGSYLCHDLWSSHLFWTLGFSSPQVTASGYGLYDRGSPLSLLPFNTDFCSTGPCSEPLMYLYCNYERIR